MSADGTLYFGSGRPGGHGLSGIYAATEDRPGVWSVRNLGPPVSTAANDYEAEISADGATLILVSDRGPRSHLYRFVRRSGRGSEVGQAPGRDDVFQVGPLLSPDGKRLLFTEADGRRSGEIYLADLQPHADGAWPATPSMEALVRYDPARAAAALDILSRPSSGT